MRRRRANAGDEPTLFPFLAVLICTVGSLIVLLVVTMQQAKATASDRSRPDLPEPPPSANDEESVRIKVDELRWRIDLLQQSREKTLADLKTREIELSYIEDEIRQVRARLDRAAAEAAHIKQLADQGTHDQQASAAELARLQEQLVQSRAELEQSRQAFNRQERSYALLPYQGANGTRRRPIYIECTADRVILQPEGVELYSDDFREPMTDDNPLASALRAQREYFADATLNREEPPYPLIVVRPDGAHAYAAARAAMEAWDAEFGYELVDKEMNLAYPPVDAALVDVVRQAVDEARARRRLLQSIAPARFGRSQPTLTASRRGGFVAQGSRDEPDGSGSEQPPDARSTGSFRSAGSGGRTESAESEASRAEPMGSGSGGTAGAPGRGFERPAADSITSRSTLSNLSDAAVGGSGAGPSGSFAARTDGASASGEAAADGRSRAESGELGPGEFDPDRAGRQHRAGPTAREGDIAAASDAAQPADARGAAHRASDTANAGRSGGAAGRDRGTPTGSASAGSASASGHLDLSPASSNPNAARAADWALPERAAGATAITRPIHISCYSDHLVIFPEPGQRSRPIAVPIQGTMREEVEQLVSKVWERIDSWGIAGSRMYWRPVLQVQVQNGGDARYAELSRLLEGSGIEVKKK